MHELSMRSVSSILLNTTTRHHRNIGAPLSTTPLNFPISSGFTPESPAQLGGKIYEMMNMALLGNWGGVIPQVAETVEAEVVEPSNTSVQK